MTLTRRRFLEMLGLAVPAAKSVFVFGTGLWRPPEGRLLWDEGIVRVNPRLVEVTALWFDFGNGLECRYRYITRDTTQEAAADQVVRLGRLGGG